MLTSDGPLTISGWTILVHPLFLAQLEKLVAAVEFDKKKDPKNYKRLPNAKLLAAIAEITLKRIPANPADARYRQGDTFGDEYKHWFREKFGNARFRLFFRFDLRAKILVYAWVNDQQTLRTYGSRNDAYAVFSAMLKNGTPPDNWQSLVATCKDAHALEAVFKKDAR